MNSNLQYFEALIADTRKILSDRFPTKQSYDTISKWIHTENGKHEDQEVYLGFTIYHLQQELQKLQSYKHLLQAIKEDEQLNRICNSYAVTPSSAYRNTPKQVIEQILEVYFEREISSETQPGADFIGALLQNLTCSEIKVCAVAHLDGFISDVDTFSITDTIRLFKMDENYRNRHLENHPASNDLDIRQSTYGLESVTTVKRIFLDHKPTPAEYPTQESLNQAFSEMYEVLFSLRIFKHGYVNFGFTQNYALNDQLNNYSSMSIFGLRNHQGGGYRINETELAAFRDFHKKASRYFRSQKLQKQKMRFANSLRWLANSSLKDSTYDMLLDHMIVLESLFLGERTGTIAYKLRLRIAYFFGKTAEERLYLFKLVGKAYEIRSRMVHEGKPLPKNINIAGKQIQSGKFLAQVRDLVYKTIRRIIIQGDSAMPANENVWNRIILGLQTGS